MNISTEQYDRFVEKHNKELLEKSDNFVDTDDKSLDSMQFSSRSSANRSESINSDYKPSQKVNDAARKSFNYEVKIHFKLKQTCFHKN